MLKPTIQNFMNLTIPEYSYMIGFIHCDGHLSENTRNRGCCSIEINANDHSLLKKFQALTPYNSTITTRTRDTNFKDNYTSICWNLFDWDARMKLIEVGMIVGKKSLTIKPPSQPYIEVDYIRGLIDADGSVGITAQNIPFVSFTTKSEHLKELYCDFIEKMAGYRPNAHRNKRDDIYNILCTVETAQLLVATLYYDGCLCLDRKLKSARKVIKWKRSKSKRLYSRHKKWDDASDQIVLSLSVEKAAKKLDRTIRSIKMRKWRLQIKRK